jgi:hypothetical protein
MARGFGATLGVSTSDIIRGAAFPTPTVYSFACWYYKNGAGGLGNARIFDKEGSTPGDIILRNSNSTSSITTSKSFSTTSGVWQTTDAEGFATGKWVHIVITYDASSTANVPTIYINGRLATVTTVTAPVGTANTGLSGTLSIGNRSTAGVDWNGMIGDCSWWNNIQLTAAEARALFTGADPRTIRPRYLNEYLVFSEGKPYSAIKATQPTVTGTKQRADRLLINQGRTIPFTQLPGTNQIVNPSKGALVITGKTPTVTINSIVAPSKGAVVISGYVPTVTLTANQVVAPAKGSVVIGGKTPTVDTNQTVSPSKGAVVIGGKTPTVTINALVSPSKGSLVIGGYAPTITLAQIIAPAKGAVRITGYTPVVDQPTSHVINPAKGSVRLTGYVPTVAVTGQTGGDTHDGASLKRHAELRKKRQKQVDALLETKIAEADEIAATIREQLAPKAPIPAISKSATKSAKVAPAAALFPTHDYEQEDEEIMALLFA